MPKLNLGCGIFRVAGWANIDLDEDVHPDVVADVEVLDDYYFPGTVQSIYAGHVLEHVVNPLEALKLWHRLLVPGGDCTVCMPDHLAAYGLYVSGQRFPVVDLPALEGWIAITTGFKPGCTEPELQKHRRSLDYETLCGLMSAAGFSKLERLRDGSHPAAPKFAEWVTWQMTVRGWKA